MKKTAAANHPKVSASPWRGNREQCPRWVGYPTRESVPAGLIWSGAGELPAIGSRVTIYLNSYGPATVNGYFHADGYLGVICSPDTLPDWFKKQSPGVTKGHFYGIDLVPRKPPAPRSRPSRPAASGSCWAQMWAEQVRARCC